jgi:V/A-type H+-transporting ATPase subunit D
MWLRHRLGVARRGLDLLDRKLRILRQEGERLRLLAESTGEEWESACREADTWLLRAYVLGGRRAVRLAGEERLAQVRVDWIDAMGTSYPGRVTCELPAPGASGPLPGTAALIPARKACRAALEAAVRHAAAREAAGVVAREVAATGRRSHALRDRLVPRMERALSDLEASIDETERADGARVRRILNTPR